jgi:hypothetical protein
VKQQSRRLLASDPDAALSTIFRRGSKRSCTRQLVILLKPNAQVKLIRVLEAFRKKRWLGNTKDRLDPSIRRYLLSGLLDAARYWRDNATDRPQKRAQVVRKLLDLMGDAEPIEVVNTLEAIAAPKRKQGRGGDRKSGSKKPQSHLVRILIGLYDRADVFRQTGWGGPLQRFVRASLDAIDAELSKRISNKAIADVFERMKTEGILKSKR